MPSTLRSLHLRKCYLLLALLMLVLIHCKPLAPNRDQMFQNGDILFQDLDCGPFCDAIEKVTVGYQGANLSHVGMVVTDGDGTTQVIEANGQGVIMTPIDTFLGRQLDTYGNPKVILARLNRQYRRLISAAIVESKALVGKSYDEVFDINNDSYYCSELIYWAFKNANNGIPLFDLQPMTFIDPDTDQTFKIWEDYYKELGVAIPENQPGLNPGGMSTSYVLTVREVLGAVSTKSESP